VSEARAFRITGPPGLAVMAACLGAFGPPPDLVVSGINAGPNTGHAILHSGTVGAALTAQTFGVSALAVSADDRRPWQWETACALVDEVLELLAAETKGTVYNLNAPGLPLPEVRGLKWASLDRFGAVRLAVAGHERGALQLELCETGAAWRASHRATIDAGEARLERRDALVTGGAVDRVFSRSRGTIPRSRRSDCKPERESGRLAHVEHEPTERLDVRCPWNVAPRSRCR
jgi:broad specificity polyphosphatase/5'/3'-nucleotidase SurE